MKLKAALATLALVALPATEASVLADDRGTDQFGPFHVITTDGSSCGGAPWAEDEGDRYWTVRDNGDGTFTVTERFRDATFTTLGTTSPGRCQDTEHHGTTVRAGVVGTFRGYITGTVTSATYNPAACAVPNTPGCQFRAGFLTLVFGPSGPATFSCFTGGDCRFNYEYSSSDRLLKFHHWQDKSDQHGGEKFVGDIADF
jgi:hypothetical protein